ncbi:hypothetical protein OROMI_011968 [Orobanche minor]
MDSDRVREKGRPKKLHIVRRRKLHLLCLSEEELEETPRFYAKDDANPPKQPGPTSVGTSASNADCRYASEAEQKYSYTEDYRFVHSESSDEEEPNDECDIEDEEEYDVVNEVLGIDLENRVRGDTTIDPYEGRFGNSEKDGKLVLFVGQPWPTIDACRHFIRSYKCG